MNDNGATITFEEFIPEAVQTKILEYINNPTEKNQEPFFFSDLYFLMRSFNMNFEQICLVFTKYLDDDCSELEKFEDAKDIVVFERAYQEYEKDGKRSRPIEELWNELGLDDCTDLKKYYNEETMAALEEAERIAYDPTAKRYSNVEEALIALKEQEND